MKRSLLLTLLAVNDPLHAGGIFWADRQSGARGIRRAAFDGSGPVQIAGLQSRSDPRGLAVDRAAGRIYFADSASLLSAVYNFTSHTAGAVSTLATGSAIRDLSLDAAARYLYYCDQTAGNINRVALSGAVADGGTFPKIVPDAYYLHAYYGPLASGGGTALRFLTTCSTSCLWLVGDTGPAWMTANSVTAPAGSSYGAEMRGVQVDGAGGWVYWCEKDTSRIRRARWLGGGSLASAPQDLYTGLNAPHGLKLDIPRHRIYWVDSGTNSGTGTGKGGVNRGDMDGSTPVETLVLQNAGSVQPWDIDLDTTTANYSEWVMLNWRRDAGTAVQAPAADPDSDGLTNGAEFALGTDPRTGDATPLTPGMWVDPAANPLGGDTYPTITFSRRTGVSGLVVLPEVSTDLTQWKSNALTPATPVTAELSVTPDEEGMERVTVRSLLPQRLHPRQLLRVKVTVP